MTKKSFKSVSEKIENLAKYSKEEEQRAIVCAIGQREDFFDRFSDEGRKELNEELAEHIKNHAEAKKEALPLVIRFILRGEAKNLERRVIEETVFNYYARQSAKLLKRYKRNFAVTFLLGAIGVILLFFLILLKTVLNGMPVLSEVIDIAAWVFLWESVDKGFFEKVGLRSEFRMLERFANAKIETDEGEKNGPV